MTRRVVHRHGRDSLRIDETPKPSPATGEVLATVSAVARDARGPTLIAEGMGTTLTVPSCPRPTWRAWSSRWAMGSSGRRPAIASSRTRGPDGSMAGPTVRRGLPHTARRAADGSSGKVVTDLTHIAELTRDA
jgi:hypothetical protein